MLVKVLRLLAQEKLVMKRLNNRLIASFKE